MRDIQRNQETSQPLRRPSASGISRRQFGGLAAGGLGALFLTACGGGTDTGGGDVGSSGGGTAGGGTAGGTLSFYNDNVAWKPGFDKAGAELKKITGFDLQPLAVPQQDAYAQLVKTSITTKKSADIAKWHEGYPLQELARTNKLTDLTAVWDAAEQKGFLDPALKASLSWSDAVYGIPLVQSYWVVFYSKPLFEKAKVKPPTTYDEFLTVAGALKAAGTTPIWTGQGDGWESFVPFVALIAAQDPDFYVALTNNEAKYTDDQVRKALELWKVWIDSKWVTPADSKLDDAAALMKSGKLAMLPIGSWYNGTLTKAGLVPDKDYGAFLFPTINNAPASVFVETAALVVPQNAPHHDGAVAQMGSWLAPEVQRGWSDFLGDNSPNITVKPTDPVLLAANAAVVSQKARKLTRYFEASPPNLINGNIQDLTKFMLDPSTAESVMTSMQSRAETEWAAWKADGG